MSETIGDDFQRLTKYRRGKISGPPDFTRRPPAWRTHPDQQKAIKLPPPRTEGGPGLWDVLNVRRSERDYKPVALSLQQLSQLLWATQGVTERIGEHLLRTAPSAGALYPIETYLVVNRVDELPRGLYHYNVAEAGVSLLKEGDFRQDAAAAALDQLMTADGAVTFIWTAIIQRSRWKYSQRCYRYIYLDAGIIGENLHLAATAMGLGCCAIGALYDDEVNHIVGADGTEETVVYMSTVGNI